MSEKVGRAIGLLRGMTYPRVVAALQPFGFGQGVLDEGWTLVRAASTVRGARPIEAPSADPSIVLRVDEWENRWYPIIDATLRRRHPDVHARIFQNLSQTSGPPVLISVQLLIDRLTALEKAEDKKSKDARALLKERGVTRGTIDEAKMLLAESKQVAAPADGALEENAAAIEQAEEELWSWYLEWSQIARASIKDGRLLQLLGFRTRKNASGAEEAEPEEEPAAPVPSPAGGTQD